MKELTLDSIIILMFALGALLGAGVCGDHGYAMSCIACACVAGICLALVVWLNGGFDA